VPAVEIALLRSLPLFAELPAPAIEGLLRPIPRTATMIAHTAATVYKLDRELFLTAVLGHAATQGRAARIADARLAADTAPGSGDTPRGSEAEPG
jgi:CRP-like cAMP-binding protein